MVYKTVTSLVSGRQLENSTNLLCRVPDSLQVFRTASILLNVMVAFGSFLSTYKCSKFSSSGYTRDLSKLVENVHAENNG